MTVLKNALAVNDGKAVVISIKREWLAKIMSGEKTLEVRKSRPWEISFPFAVFCYETKANGEKLSGMADKFIRESCIDIAALFEYGNKTGMLYGWNISNVRKLSLPMRQLHLKRAPQSWQYINLNADDIESVAAAIE